jgi:hypothetical protein
VSVHGSFGVWTDVVCAAFHLVAWVVCQIIQLVRLQPACTTLDSLWHRADKYASMHKH